MLRIICTFCLIVVRLLCGGVAQAGQLGDRLAHFPHWANKPPVSAADGDLVYPEWMEGTWNVTSTLDLSNKECRDAKFRVSTRVQGLAPLISGDVYWWIWLHLWHQMW